MKNNQCHSGRAIKHAGLLMVLLLAPVFTAGAQDPFMQYPDIQGNTIVFASGGEPWGSLFNNSPPPKPGMIFYAGLFLEKKKKNVMT